MRSCRSEPTLSELLSDPIVRAVMAADGVAPEELRESLNRIAGSLEQRHSELRRAPSLMRQCAPI